MDAVRINIIRYLDDSYPGFVECQLIDAIGREPMTMEDLVEMLPLRMPGKRGPYKKHAS